MFAGIEQARFTCSPLEKAFWKTNKNNWRSRRKTNESSRTSIKDQGQVKIIKKRAYDTEDTPFISKQKEIFNELVHERLEKITDLNKKKLIAMI